MGWIDYYTLLEENNGDLSKAPENDLAWAARCNPNDPESARKVAEKIYKENDHATGR